MAIVVSIAGYSGTGKSRSFKNMDWDKTFLIRCNHKPLPFKNKLKKWDSKTKTGNYIISSDYTFIQQVLKKLPEYGFKAIIIDDSTHLITDHFMKTAMEKGFDKFAIMALNYYNLLKTAEALPEDVRVYFINHLDETPNGEFKIKTIGKMLDEKVDIPSLLTIAIGSKRTDNGYKFQLQNSGYDFFKSPEDMFEEEEIDNDLKIVDDAIIDYYGLEK